MNSETDAEFRQEQSHIKQGWSTLTALHTVLLPEALSKVASNTQYQPPLLEILAKRWQNRCQEVKQRIGPSISGVIILSFSLIHLAKALISYCNCVILKALNCVFVSRFLLIVYFENVKSKD